MGFRSARFTTTTNSESTIVYFFSRIDAVHASSDLGKVDTSVQQPAVRDGVLYAASWHSMTGHQTERGRMSEGRDPGDQQATCRICLAVEDDLSMLVCPCACKGTLKYVHEACLFSWIDQSRASNRCEVCKMCYVVSPVYAEDAPSCLPLGDLTRIVVWRMVRCSLFIGRFALVSATWFVAVPLVTTSFWRLAFARSLRDAFIQIASRFHSPVLVLLDCVTGVFSSVLAIVCLTGISTLHAYVKQLSTSDTDLGEREVRAAENLAADDAVNDEQNLREQVAVVRVGHDDDDVFEEGFPEDFAAFNDLAFEDLVGLRGPLSRLFEHAATLATSNALFILIAAFFPFNFGRAVLVWLNFWQNKPLLQKRMVGSGGVIGAGMVVGAVSYLADPLRRSPNMMYAAKLPFTFAADAKLDPWNKLWPMLLDKLETQLALPRLTDFATLALGYSLLAAIGAFCLVTLSLIRAVQMDVQTTSSIRTSIRFFQDIFLCIKVILLLAFDLILFPALCGWWLELNSLRLFAINARDQIEFHTVNPMTSSAAHWAVGLLYILCVAIIISLMREIVRPDVLAFIRDPTDPNRNPFRELVQQHWLMWHVRRIVMSTVIYGTGVVLMIHIPVEMAVALVPEGFFPLSFSFSGIVGIEQLVLHFFAPFIVERVDIKKMARWLLHGWLRWTSSRLRLSQYLRPEIHVQQDNSSEVSNVEGATGDANLTLHISEIHGAQVVDDLVAIGVSADLDLPWTDQVSSLTSWAAQLVSVPPTKMIVSRGGVILEEHETLYDCISPEARLVPQPVLEISFQSFGKRPSGVIIVYIRSTTTEKGQTTNGTWELPLSVRIAILVTTSFMVLCVISTACIIVPVAIGRRLFCIAGLSFSDVYAFSVGVFVAFGATFGTVSLLCWSRKLPSTEFIGVISNLSVTFFKLVILSVEWLVVLPLLIGLLFGLLTLRPICTSDDVFLLWMVGLLLLKLWFRLVTAGLAAPPTPPDLVKAFRIYQQEGFKTLDLAWISTTVFFPLIGSIFAAISFPFMGHVMSHVISTRFNDYNQGLMAETGVYFGILRDALDDDNNARFVHLHAAGLLLAVEFLRRLEGTVSRFKQNTRDDHYLIGRCLVNFSGHVRSIPSGSSSMSLSE